jgi:dolichol-phosphate mannosyltransferase
MVTSESRERRRVAVIVPTLNEADNIDLLLEAILAQSIPFADLEILVADGGSADGTVDRVREWASRAPVRLIACDGTQGLAGDVLAAARSTTAEVLVVMDADLSHPPALIGELIRPLIEGACDMAIGSRYVAGGDTPGWPLRRRLLSRGGSLLARLLTDIADPLSGFFAVRRDRLLAVDSAAAGFKIALEVLAVGGDSLRVVEVPFSFRDRVRGQSKIGWRQLSAYVQRLMALAGGAVSLSNAQRFAAVGLLGVGVDFIAFQLLFGLGFDLASSHIASFTLATFSNYLLNARWTFAAAASSGTAWLRYPRFLAICLLALCLRGGVLSVATDIWHLSPQIGILLGIAAGAAVNYVGSAFYVFPSTMPVPPSVRWRVIAFGVALYVLALRFAFLGSVDLLPEEAYYWNYAQHLDIGYLDHPPMVAWLIWLSTGLFGDSEFAVRMGAYVCWVVTAIFCFRTARNLYGNAAAYAVVLLLASLPFFFGIGMLMTPDAPLTAAWAAALYFLERAMLGEQRRAWWYAGICVGLGLLSKYTIALLGPATLLFLVLDPRARAWFRRPQPYAAILMAVVLFSPVIVWNAQHDWASFMFQGPQRLQAAPRFYLFHLLGAILLLLTPVGFAAVVVALFRRASVLPHGTDHPRDRRALFVATFTLVPLSVFVVFSLSHQVKLDWTGPLWLAILPLLAADMTAAGPVVEGWSVALRRAWRPTIAAMLLLYGAGLHYLALGLPGIGYSENLATLPIAWKEFGRQAAMIEEEVKSSSGNAPLRVGLDQYFLSSQMAFYDPVDRDGARNTAGRSLLGRNSSLMYDYWYPAAQQHGRTLILFALTREDLADASLETKFSNLGPIREQIVKKRAAPAGRFYYRVGYNFRSG